MSPDFQLVLQFVVGLTFLSSAVSKLLTPALFFDGLRDYRIFPRWSVPYLGAAVIALEGLIAFSYISGWLLKPAGILALGLLAVFLSIATFALKRGVKVKCLCFGASDMEPLSVRTVVRIGLLASVLLALMTLWLDRDDGLRAAYSAWQIITALTCAVLVQILTSWALAIPEVVRLAQKCRTCEQRTAEE